MVAVDRVEQLIVTVTIDTECDHDPHWKRSNPLRFDSITRGLPERLQPRFHDVGAVPTYLLTVEVLEDAVSVETLRKLDGAHELGTHLHAAFVEPGKRFHDYAGIDSPDLQCLDAPALEAAKLVTLSELFESKLGHAPTSFRAGRFGAGASTIDALEVLGYRVDTSVTPHMRWREPRGRVDFRRAPEQPYHPEADRIDREGPARSGRLLEVPVTLKPRWWRSAAWFRPWFSSVDGMKAVARYHLQRHAHRRVVVLNMMFHSMEIIEQASPYPQDSDDVKRYLDDLQAALAWCADEGARFMPLSALADVFSPP